MNWAMTFLVGLLGLLMGATGMFLIAFPCLKWYRISNFEGASGYFVVGLTLVGGMVGFILSFIAARLGHAWVGPQWYVQTGGGLAAVALALLVSSWLLFLHAHRLR